MVIRTFFDKNNTIVSNLDVNTGLNPVSELFYGGAIGEQKKGIKKADFMSKNFKF